MGVFLELVCRDCICVSYVSDIILQELLPPTLQRTLCYSNWVAVTGEVGFSSCLLVRCRKRWTGS